jgi:hypothetical protein
LSMCHCTDTAVAWRRMCAPSPTAHYLLWLNHHNAIAHCQCAIIPTRPSKATRVRSDTLNCVQFAVATRTAQAPLPIVSAPSYLRGRRMAARLRSDTLGCVPFAVAECTARAVRLIANALFVSARPSKRDACMQRYARLERLAVATHTAQALLPVVNVPVYRCGVQWRSVCAATRPTAQHLLWLVNAPSYIRGRQWAARVHSDTLDHRRYCSLPMRSSYQRGRQMAACVRSNTVRAICYGHVPYAARSHCSVSTHNDHNAAVGIRRVYAAHTRLRTIM